MSGQCFGIMYYILSKLGPVVPIELYSKQASN